MKLKKISSILLLASVFTLFSTAAHAQKYAYVNTEYMLSKIPEYQASQEELNEISKKWEQEIEQKYQEIERLYKAYQADKVLLPDEMKKKREEEIVRKEKEVQALQKKRFGVNGDLFKKRQELIEPIQEKIWEAVNQLAQTGGYAFIFDKANQGVLLYADPKYDKSDQILKKMGYKVD